MFLPYLCTRLGIFFYSFMAERCLQALQNKCFFKVYTNVIWRNKMPSGQLGSTFFNDSSTRLQKNNVIYDLEYLQAGYQCFKLSVNLWTSLFFLQSFMNSNPVFFLRKYIVEINIHLYVSLMEKLLCYRL